MTINVLIDILVGSLDFFALIFICYAIFRFDVSRNLLPSIIFSVILSIISTTLLKLNILLPAVLIFQLLLILIFFKYYLKEKLLYSIWSILVGYFSYALIQSLIVLLFVNFNYVSVEELKLAFGLKGDIVSITYSTIALVISIYLKIFNGGFALYFRKSKNESFKSYFIISFITLVVTLICAMIINYSTEIGFILSIISLVITTSITLYIFSKRRDDKEYDI